MATHPVLAIGIGRTGCNILSAIDEVVTAEGVEDYFQFLAIDSSNRDLQAFAPESATTYELTIDRGAYNCASDSLDYLQSEPELVPEAGTARRRPLGRYLVDSNADSASLYDCLLDQINTLSETSSDLKPRQVWIINSLGGGTGSGAFPLVTLLLQRCSSEIEEAVEIFGVGSLPRLDRLQEQFDVPDGEPVHYANAYTALAELRKLMNIDGETTYPIEIDIDSSPANISSTSLSIDQNPFEGYWLLGFNEADRFYADDDSRSNRWIARLIFYLASADTDGWFRQGHLYSIAGASVEIPIEELQRFYTLNRELSQLDDELGTLRNRRESLITAAEWIESLLRVSSQAPPADRSETCILGETAESLPVGENLKSDCKDLISVISVTSEPDSPQTDVFEKRVQDIVQKNRERIADNVPAEHAIKFLCASLLRKQIRQEIATHPLPGYLHKLGDTWLSDEIDEPPQPEIVSERSSQDESFQEWRETLLNRIQEQMEDLQERISNSLTPRFVSGSGQQLTEFEDDVKRAERFVAEYENLRGFEIFLTDQIEESRQQLKEQRRNLEKRAEDKQEVWEKTQQRWARLSQQRSQLESSMKELTRQEGRVCVPLHLEKDAADSELRNSNFTSLLSKGLLSKQDLRKSFEEGIALLEEPVEDLAESQFGKTTGRLGIIAADGDHSLLREILLNGEEKSGSLRRELYYKFEDINDLVSGKQSSSLSLLGFYSPVSLQYTSEFGTIHQYHMDPDSDVSSLLGSISDSDLQKRFAYPELLDQPD
ncbi:tubulin-like doman-containing protein [Natrinema longum]|uniref:tubulin-like doman-containing protein n=1 Tax=Natrinema longum TaxID=370324 RepID=UPI001CCF94AE|nr:tubulin-like doman-containing protein [Natrinema longum]MBZ6497173.1 hypothetical protein [Natrinema longum]